MVSEKRKYLFKFYYIGSKKYHGSQRQLDFPTVESLLINALQKKKYITDLKKANFEVASRTDKLVSARGASFSIITRREPILMEINSELSHEIGLWAYTKVPLDFSSRFNALYRHYKYIHALKYASFKEGLSISIDLMKRACKALEGNHDFKNFTKRESNNIKTIRTLKLASVDSECDYLIFDFKSKSFLRQQIRRMVAKLIEVGMGKLSYEEFLQLLNISTYISYQPANPIGLILWDIIYEDNIKFQTDIKSVDRMMSFFNREEKKVDLKRFLFHILQHNNVS
ncbi:MAG: tRNA pseudouridine synthase A [Candidatus Odinarchaeota archaeon]